MAFHPSSILLYCLIEGPFVQNRVSSRSGPRREVETGFFPVSDRFARAVHTREREPGRTGCAFAAGFKNTGEPLADAALVMAWLDADGRVIRVEKSGLAEGTATLEKRDSANIAVL